MTRGETSGRARSAMMQLAGARAVSIVAMAVGFAVLGRLLSPEVFGHFAIAMAIYAVLQTLVEFGLRQFLIRAEDEIDTDTIRLASRLSFLLAALGCGLCFAADLLPATVLAEDIQDALKPMGLALLISPILLGREARLQRSLSFGAPAVSTVIGTIVDVVTAIALAMAGFGVMALALALLASRIAGAAVIFVFGRLEEIRDTAEQERPTLRRLLSFGRDMTAVSLLPSLANLALLAILGGVAGAATVGLYNRAHTIRQLLDRTLLEGISPAVLPAISEALRGGTPPAQVLAVKLDYLVALIWPAFGVIALLADPLVFVMLGPQWEAAVPAVRILAIAGIALPFTKMMLKFFAAIDRLPVYFRIQMVHIGLRLGLGGAAAFISLEAFCAALTLSVCIKAALIVQWCRTHFETGANAHRGAMLRGLILTAATLAPPALLLWLGLGGVPAVFAGLPAAGLGWLVGIALTAHPLAADLRLWRILPAAMRRQP